MLPCNEPHHPVMTSICETCLTRQAREAKDTCFRCHVSGLHFGYGGLTKARFHAHTDKERGDYAEQGANVARSEGRDIERIPEKVWH